jgi:hypothetical protein
MHLLFRAGFWAAANAVATTFCSGAAVVSTSDFTQITGGAFINLPGDALLTPITWGNLTITPSLTYMSGSFSNFPPPGRASDPSDGEGFLASLVTSGWKAGPVTLNFSMPVAAFGATFVHFPPTHLSGWGLEFPASVRAYDGVDGTGNLLGEVGSAGWTGEGNATMDFVALWSSNLNIRSVVLGRFSDPESYAVDGYGIGLVPVPEPSAGLLFVVWGVAMGRRWRQGVSSALGHDQQPPTHPSTAIGGYASRP